MFYFLLSLASALHTHTHVHAPRKSMQRYYFFSKPPNNQQKNETFLAFFCQNSPLFIFCHFDFAKFGFYLLNISVLLTSHKSPPFNHLHIFSTTPKKTLKTHLKSHQNSLKSHSKQNNNSSHYDILRTLQSNFFGNYIGVSTEKCVNSLFFILF